MTALRITTIILALAALAALFWVLTTGSSVTSVHAQTPETPTPVPTTEQGRDGADTKDKSDRLRHRNLDSNLNQLVEQAQTSQGATGATSATAPEPVAVELHITEGYVQDVWDWLEKKGASPRNSGVDFIEAYISASLLPAASEREGVVHILTLYPPMPAQGTVVSEGVALHGAAAWHDAGYKGKGVKIAIIDSGFQGFQSLMGTELPSTVEARCYTSTGVFTSSLSDCDNSDTGKHGTAVAEAVFDIAPEATYYISRITSAGDLLNTVEWLIEQDVDVINKSLGWVWHGPGDGTSPFSLSPLKSVDAAVAGGITWVNAAGNGNGKTWFGAFTNEYHNSESGEGYHESTLMHEFAHMDECNAVELTAEREYLFQLRWDDSWGAARDDLDLFLYRGETVSRENVVAYSYNDQDGGMFPLPFEGFIFSPESSGTYCIGVMFWSGFSPDWIQIEMWGGRETFEHHTLSHSITHPADSANPGMLAVGAAAASSTATIEPYSSRGPTTDGRVKPDIVGVDKADSSIYGRWSGTSQSSPHVAGLAALVKQRLPSHTPQQIAQYLKTHAEERGAAGPDNTWGHGFATLPVEDVTAQCQPAGAPGLTVSGLAATATFDTVSLSWNAPSGGAEVTGYRILRRAVDSERHFQVLSADTGGTSTTWTDSSVGARTKYSYRVCALDERGGGDLSTNATVMTDFAPLPGRVTGLTRTATHDTVLLRWDAPSDGAEVTGYRILRRAVDSEKDFSVLEWNTFATSTTWTDSSVSARTRYSYRVRAHGEYGEGELSKPATVITDPIPPNSPATGVPIIYGTALVGETLTARLYDIYDADGVPSWYSQYSFQWLADDADISGATSTEYLLTEAELGKFIKMRMSFTDRRGHDETLTSEATEAVAYPPLTARFYIWTFEHDGSTPFRFQLIFSEDFPGELDEEKLRDAFQVENGSSTSATRTVKGQNAWWEISMRPDSLEDVVITLPATTDCSAAGAVCTESGRPLSNTITATVWGNSTATGTPIIIGTAQVGETLTVSTSTISDADGLDNVTFDYSWYRDRDWIRGVRGSSYTLALADEGKAVSVRASFTDDRGNGESLRSTSTEAVAPPPPPPPPPEVTGVEVVSTPESGDTYAIGESIRVQVTFTADVTSFGSPRLKIKMDPNYGEKWATEYGHLGNSVFFAYKVVEPNVSTQGIAVPENTLDLNGGSIATWDEIRLNHVHATDLSHDGLDHDPTHKVDWRANRMAKGTPYVYGTVEAGETLTAATWAISDADGLENVNFSYQWLADDANISGATSSTYTLVAADEDKAVKVRVSFTDDAGHAETLTSAAAGTVEVPAAPTPPPELIGVEVISTPASGDTYATGETIKVQVTFSADLHSFGPVRLKIKMGPNSGEKWATELGTPGNSIVFKHKVVEPNVSTQGIAVPENALDLNGGSINAYDEARNEFVSATDVSHAGLDHDPKHKVDWTLRPDLASVVMKSLPNTYTGDTFTATSGLRNEGEGPTDGWLFYYRSTDANGDTSGFHVGAAEVPEVAASSSIEVSHTMTAPYTAGTYYYVACVWAREGESDTTNNCSPVQEMVVFGMSPATGAPTISGVVRVGQTLTADTSGISDANGLTNATFSYQWLADDANISGATSSTYTLAAADEGKVVKVRVSFTDDEGYDETLTSAATAEVAAAPPAPPENSPAAGAPTITGTARVGETLTAARSGISDADGLNNASFKYQWLADDADISGATRRTYLLATADKGKAVKVRVSFTDDAGHDETLTSEATAAVVVETAPVENNAATGAPMIRGTARVGETLTARTTRISDSDGLTNATFSYQWLADDADISGATSSTYTLAAADEGKAIKVRVSFTDDEGNDESLTSVATSAVVAALPPPAPTNLVVSDNGNGTLTLTWDAPDDDSVTGYQVLRRRPNEGEKTLLIHVADTGSTDTTLTDEDVTIGTQHVYRVKAISAAGLSGASNLVRATPASPPENNAATGTPTISGTAQVGETLTAGVSGISDADGLTNATFIYQWLADDADISGATSSTYTLVEADKGKAIEVRVSFTDDAGNAETLTSSATAAVAAATPPDSSGVAVTSSPASGDTYGLGETIQVTLTFSEAVDVTGMPRLKIDMDPADWGEKWATYESGSGTTSLTFTHEVVQPNESTQGIAVLADTLELNGGTIKSTTTEADADLAHDGLAHDANHKVDWQ